MILSLRSLKLLTDFTWPCAMAELSWVRMCYDLVISWWRRQILCLAWITFAVRDTYWPPEPLNSCRTELKPNHPVSAVSLSLLLPPSITLFPLSLFHSLPPSFPFLLFESDTQSILITFRSERGRDQMFKSVVSKTAVLPFFFTARPLHDCTAASIGHISRGSWVAAVSSWRWPCVLQS